MNFLRFKGHFIPVSWFWVAFHATSVQMDSVHQYLEEAKILNILVHQPFFFSLRLKSKVDDLPVCHGIQMHALLLGVSRVYIEWTVSACSNRITPITLPPFNHGSVENALLKRKSLSWEHTKCIWKQPNTKKSLPSPAEAPRQPLSSVINSASLDDFAPMLNDYGA